MKITILFFFAFYTFSNCIYFQNQKLKQIRYPETAYFSGFDGGQVEVNPYYSVIWCKMYCEEIKSIVNNLPEQYYLEIIVKLDGTETLENRQKLSLGRANSIRQLLLNYGIFDKKLKAIVDPEPNKYLGNDLFDPENRFVLFLIKHK